MLQCNAPNDIAALHYNTLSLEMALEEGSKWCQSKHYGWSTFRMCSKHNWKLHWQTSYIVHQLKQSTCHSSKRLLLFSARSSAKVLVSLGTVFVPLFPCCLLLNSWLIRFHSKMKWRIKEQCVSPCDHCDCLLWFQYGSRWLGRRELGQWPLRHQ